MLARSFDGGVEKMFITGGCLKDCEEAILLAKTDGLFLFYLYIHAFEEEKLEYRLLKKWTYSVSLE